MGYSTGAQMSLLLASFEPDVSRVIAMVPPFVTSPDSPVAPRVHAHRIELADVPRLAGSNDTYAARQDTALAFGRVQSSNRSLVWFESGHRLPLEYLKTVSRFIRR